MKTKDVVILNQVLQCLQENRPIEQELLDDFSVAVCNCTMVLDKQKSRYQEKAPYHRQKTKEWVKSNPEKVRKYREAYKMKKKRKSHAKASETEEAS